MSGDYLADSPEHKFRPQDRLPGRCGFVSDGMSCGYDREEHEALWPGEPSASTPGDLADFLTARYDEAQARAKAGDVGHGQWTATEHADDGWLILDEHGDLVANVRPERSWDGGTAAYIAANDPARRLADIKLKRAILAEHAHDDACSWPDRTKPRGFGCSICDWDRDYGQGDGGWCATVRQLGTEFAEHPAYRPEWRPE